MGMGKDKEKEHIRRETNYAYEIDLLKKGTPIKTVVKLSKENGMEISRATIQRLRREFVTFQPNKI